MSIYLPPLCPTCKVPLLRWSWWETKGEKIVYWYCLECDKEGVEPCIHAQALEDMVLIKIHATRARCKDYYRNYRRPYAFKYVQKRGFQIYTTLRSYLNEANRLEELSKWLDL